MRKRVLFVLSALARVAPALASAETPLQQMQADATALNAMAQTWPQLQAAAQSYGQLAPYAAQEWAGAGPTVTTPYGGVEQCHNTRWDEVTSGLITGGLNIGGDAEAEAYAIQSVAVDFQMALGDYLVQQVQMGNSALASELMQSKGPLIQALNNLNGLLNTTGNQIASAISPSTALHPLPISNWLAGIGNVPNLSAVRYIPGPNDGVPIGWSVPPTNPLAKLVDICPTGTGSIPMLPLAKPVLFAAQQAVADEPELANQLQPIEAGSTYSLPAGGFGGPLTGAADGLVSYQTRMQLVAALAANMQPIAGYMQPIDSLLALYNRQVQQIVSEVKSNAQQ